MVEAPSLHTNGDIHPENFNVQLAGLQPTDGPVLHEPMKQSRDSKFRRR